MTDLEHRWARLVETARPAPASPPRAVRSDWVARVARRGLASRTAASPRSPERLAWAGLTVFAAAAACVALLWPGPIAEASDALATRVSSLPRALPRPPRLPLEVRPALPPARDALAALPRWPEPKP